MGYYTDFSLDILCDANAELGIDVNRRDEILQHLSEKCSDELNELVHLDPETNKLQFVSLHAKWYDWEVVMKKLSATFPSVVFQLDGIGEEGDDRWRAYFLDGRMHMVMAQITFPPFDAEKLS